jgi:hypothetical protein
VAKELFKLYAILNLVDVPQAFPVQLVIGYHLSNHHRAPSLRKPIEALMDMVGAQICPSSLMTWQF